MASVRAATRKRGQFETEFSLKKSIQQFNDYDLYRNKLPEPDEFILSAFPLFINCTDTTLDDWQQLFNLCFRHIIIGRMTVELATAIYTIFERFHEKDIEIDEEVRDYAFYLIIQTYLAHPHLQAYLDILKKPFWKNDYALLGSEKLTSNNNNYLSANTSTLFNMSYTPAMAAHHSHIVAEQHRLYRQVNAESPERFNFSLLRFKQAPTLTTSHPQSNNHELNIINAIHDAAYLDLLKRYSALSQTLGLRLPLDKHGDTLMSPNSYQAAIEAACITMNMINASFKANKPAIVMARPPGHHAGRNFGEGFCLINNIACAALQLIEQHKLNRLLILDIDAHKGNGTYDIACHHPAFQRHVTFEDIYYDHIYHGHDDDDITPEVPPSHVHVEALTKPASLRKQEKILAHIEHCIKKSPYDFVLVSFGLDGHRRDPLGGELGYIDEFFVAIVRILNEKMRGKCAFVVEGGYNQTVNMRVINRCLEVIDTARVANQPK